MPAHGTFTCENCEQDYFTGPGWEDECYCEDCYFELFPTVCGYTFDHDTVITYEGSDGVQWYCRNCGAEGWDE